MLALVMSFSLENLMSWAGHSSKTVIVILSSKSRGRQWEVKTNQMIEVRIFKYLDPRFFTKDPQISCELEDEELALPWK